jgi:hypothetical protein
MARSNFYLIVQKGLKGPAKPKLVPTMSGPTLMSVYSDYTDDKDEKIQNGMGLHLQSNNIIEIHNRAAQWMSEINSQEEKDSH